MRSKFIPALALVFLAGCSKPSLPDPRFELPTPPSELTAPAPQLKKIEAPKN